MLPVQNRQRQGSCHNHPSRKNRRSSQAPTTGRTGRVDDLMTQDSCMFFNITVRNAVRRKLGSLIFPVWGEKPLKFPFPKKCPKGQEKQPPHFQPTPPTSRLTSSATTSRKFSSKKKTGKDPALSHDTPIKVSRAEAKFLRVIFFFVGEEEEPSK